MLRFANTSSTGIDLLEGCSLIAPPFVGARYPTLKRIARRRAEEERADALYRPRVTTK